MTAPALPTVGTTAVDGKDPGRKLHIDEVVPVDRLGRQVRGRLEGGVHDGRRYATDFRTFGSVWRVP